MVKIVVDTSVLINHLRNKTDDFEILTQLQDNGKAILIIPYMVVVELFAGESTKQKPMRRSIDKIIEKATLADLSLGSAICAGELIGKLKHLPDPYDLIIAAIALENHAQIATHNPKHFRLIPKIKLWKPKTGT